MAKSSFVERNKAIREAWNREQELVQKGKGTREWTPEQQKDIIEKGRAYDDNGKAFEGQHMKSAEKYPEYQGEAGNIQFLTRTEHLEAHDGNWQNPSNWYYNPATKEKIDFGDGPFVPCEIIQLTEPFVSFINTNECIKEKVVEENIQDNNLKSVSHQKDEQANRVYKKPETLLDPKIQVAQKTHKKFYRDLKSVGSYIVEHPFKSLEVAGVVIIGAAKVISVSRESGLSGTKGRRSQTNSNSARKSNVDKVADIVENDVL